MIKINKFLAASVVTLSLAACDLASYSSIAVYADQAAKVVCDERYWVAARSGPGTEYELEHKLSNGKDITILEQTTGADGKVWYKAKYNLAANNEECVSYIRSDFVSAGTGTAASDNAQTGDASADTGNADAIQQNNEEQLALATASGAYATGTITGGNVYVRNAAGTSGTTKVVSLNWNHQVDIIGETRVNGVVWYNVKGTLNGKAFTGWTISTYIKVTYNNSGDNTDFVTAMKNAGFPDSYIPNLTALHNKYPGWTFEAVNTGLNWDTVIENESVNGLNLVSKSADNAKKSTAAGAYNWSTNTWVEYEPGWVSASSAYIAYLMDPRNFLDETNIFQFQSLAYSPNEALEGVKSIVKGTFMEGTKTYSNNGEKINYASTFMDVAKSSGVSAYHIASRIKQEQGKKGTSPLISGTYSGYEGYYTMHQMNGGGFVVANTDDEAKIDRIMKVLDAYGNQDLWMKFYNGVEGMHSEVVNGESVRLPDDPSTQQNLVLVPFNQIATIDFQVNVLSSQLTDDRAWAVSQAIENVQENQKYVKSFAGDGMPESITSDYPDIANRTLYIEYATKIITGEYSIDKFDEFVEKWYATGGTEVTEKAREWYAKKAQ